MAVTLLDEVNTDTVGTAWTSDGSKKSLLVDVVDFAGGTVTIEMQRLGGPWIIPNLLDGNPMTFTANAFHEFQYRGQGLFVRATLSGAGVASKVNVRLD